MFISFHNVPDKSNVKYNDTETLALTQSGNQN